MKLVVVENLAFTRVLDTVGHFPHGGIQAVDGDETDRCILRPVALRRHIALAGIDRELHPDLGALIQGAQDKLRVENDNIAHRLDVAGGNRTGTLLLGPPSAWARPPAS